MRGKDNKTQVWAHYRETERSQSNYHRTTQEGRGDESEEKETRVRRRRRRRRKQQKERPKRERHRRTLGFGSSRVFMSLMSKPQRPQNVKESILSAFPRFNGPGGPLNISDHLQRGSGTHWQTSFERSCVPTTSQDSLVAL